MSCPRHRVARCWTSGSFIVGHMKQCVTVALVAHDNCKDDLVAWAAANRDALARYRLVATGTTGHLIAEALDLPVERMRSGPLGGDLQIGAAIVEGGVDMLVFFWDPLTAQPHEPDVKALLRIAVLRDIPTASNRATANHLISSGHLLFPSAREGGITETASAGAPGGGRPAPPSVRSGAANGWLAGADPC